MTRRNWTGWCGRAAVFAAFLSLASPVAWADGQLLPNAEQTFVDLNGRPLAAGSVYFYVPDTTTLKSTWKDKALTVLNTNPVVLDAAGRAVIYGNGEYSEKVLDVHGNLQWNQHTQIVPAPVIPPGSVCGVDIFVCGVPGGAYYAAHGSFSFSVPANIQKVLIRLKAAGGAGGGVGNGGSVTSGAGGGEERKGWFDVVPLSTVFVNVGQGGVGGNSSGSNGTDGADSTVVIGGVTVLRAKGGLHSQGSSTGINLAFGDGGSGGTGGYLSIKGTAGGLPTNILSIVMNGMGGGSAGGGGAMWGIATDGVLPGTGGSGATSGPFGGGNGADGDAEITFF